MKIAHITLTLLTFAMLTLPLTAQAFMMGRVDGNRVSYSAEKEYIVDSSYKYIGTYTTSVNVVATNNSANLNSNTLINEVYGKLYGDTNEIIEIFIAQWVKLPNKWRVSTPGPIKENLYDFKVSRFLGLAAFLTEKGYTYPVEFFGGTLDGFGYLDTYTKHYFAIAITTMPPTSDRTDVVRSTYAKNIKPAQ